MHSDSHIQNYSSQQFSRMMPFLLWGMFIAMAIWSLTQTQVSLTTFIEGYPNASNLVQEMFPPNFKNIDSWMVVIAETIAMGVWGTLIGMLLALPLGVMAAKNMSPNPIIYRLTTELINVFRSIPDIVYALIFVVSIGTGSLAGILAIIFATVGVLGKLYAESFETANMQVIEALKSTGSNYISIIFHGLLPQVSPLISNYTLYMLDHNIRAAMALGLVGAGGIGFEMYSELKYFNYDQVSAILMLILGVLIVLDRVSAYLRTYILDGNFSSVGWSAKKSLIYLMMVSLAFIATIYGPNNLEDLLSAWPIIKEQVSSSFPPDFSQINLYLELMVETLAIAFAGTFIAIIISIPLGIVLARNIVSNPLVYNVVSFVVNLLRGIPDLIFAIIFVASFGLGPFAGVLALAFHITGFLSRFYAETIEQVDTKSIEALTSTGATKLEVFFHSIVPQVLPFFNSYNLFMFDRNVRAATVMGVAGAGGIGFELLMSVRLFEFQQTLTIILLILITVSFVNRFSTYLRQKLV